MVWKPGVSGNPAGARVAQLYTNELRVAMGELDGKKQRTKLRRVIDTLYREACKGKAWAVIEIGNRLDGKSRERVDHDHNTDDELIALFRMVSQNTNGDNGGYGGLLVEGTAKEAEN